ncbi:uncharacterized protein IL334_006633 [Kwoniella shivajii]|uniref:VWFA domain-containing protein n=1 Tax=Kwoniella shivajii TaxID=564305 RepID=A0ABZ1D865_9TREE|nr:hypothetical protein IL334_006633 [Kwoniella shivajii]
MNYNTYPGTPTMDRRLRHNLSPMLSASNVQWALANRQYTSDPEYVKAVIRNYVHYKVQRGKGKSEIAYKLEVLERDSPMYASGFRAIREEYGLAPSRVLPAPRVSSTSSSSNNNLRRTQTATPTSTTSRPTTSGITRTHTTVGATTNRPTTTNDDELAPPPYASQDPDPASTRILQESLAAEAELGNRLSTNSLNNTTTTTSTATHSTSTNDVTPPTPISSRRPETPRSPIQEGPSRVPSDPELARVWEESQLEEAKRASRAWQMEQDELQEAMRLSLAESESRGEGSSSQQGSSHQPITTIPEEQSIGATNSSGMSDLVEGVNDMYIPGSYNPASPSTSYDPASSSASHSNRPVDILDTEENTYFGQTPLTPQKTGFHMGSKNPFLSSNEKEQLQAMEQAALATPQSEFYRSPSTSSPGSSYTNFATPSGNPAQARQSVTSPIAGPSQTTFSSPSSPPAAADTAHPRTPPGSGHTHYAPASSESNKQTFTPPPGPPPSHLSIVTPTSPSTRPLPATPKDNFPWDEASSQRIAFPQPMPSPTQTNLASPVSSSHNNLLQTLQGPPDLPPRPKSFVVPAGKEDPLEMLKEYDTVFLVDDSTSMAGDRWSQARLALMEVAEIAARYDENGVDIYFLNSKRVGKELRAAHEVEDLFRGLEPKGATPTGMRLEAILRDYMAKLERSQTASRPESHSSETVKPMNLIVVTDGAPTDDPESVLISIAKRLDRGEFPLSQVGVQFLQIGNDSEAREALQELDDGLASAHGVRDIVDTVPYTGEDMSAGLIIKTLLGGINRRLDRRSSA